MTILPPLNPGEVHLWWVRLDDPASPHRVLMDLLSADEVARAAGFVFERDRARFVTARAALRVLLGVYARTDPRAIRFSYSPHGKPSLAPAPAADTVCFNVSHSGGLALIGVARDRAVGVDVERIRDDVEIDMIARRFFSRAEAAAIAALPPARRRGAFFACWVRKEAYLKARGDGLSHRLDAFSVSVDPDANPVRLHDAAQAAPSGWSVWSLDAGPGYAAAAAVEGSTPRSPSRPRVSRFRRLFRPSLIDKRTIYMWSRDNMAYTVWIARRSVGGE